jgi:FkbM family methyltransferase
MPKVKLNNGLTVSCIQKHDVAIVNAEVQTYFENGISVQPGDVVLDVGANIGLFALAAWKRADENLLVHCFEPVGSVFKVLKTNLDAYDSTHLFAYNFGLSDKAGTVDFAYYPNAPVLSTAFPDDAADLIEIKQATLTNIINMPEAPFYLKLLKCFPNQIRAWILDKALKQTLIHEQVSCDLKTLSQFVAEKKLTKIDLLKIDAEKAELDILLGINKQDWALIKQVVVDVHNLDDRLNKVLALLKANGIDQIAIEQPPTMIGSTVYTLLARRL